MEEPNRMDIKVKGYINYLNEKFDELTEKKFDGKVSEVVKELREISNKHPILFNYLYHAKEGNVQTLVSFSENINQPVSEDIAKEIQKTVLGYPNLHPQIEKVWIEQVHGFKEFPFQLLSNHSTHQQTSQPVLGLKYVSFEEEVLEIILPLEVHLQLTELIYGYVSDGLNTFRESSDEYSEQFLEDMRENIKNNREKLDEIESELDEMENQLTGVDDGQTEEIEMEKRENNQGNIGFQ